MISSLLESLYPVTPEEEKILSEKTTIHKELYTSEDEFIIDSGKLLEKGKLIDIRKHTRFAYFPVHRHNYIEMTYVLSGTLKTTINETETIHMNQGDLLILNRHAKHDIQETGMDDISINFLILPEFFSRHLITVDKENVLRDFLISTVSNRNSANDYFLFHTKDILPVENLLENLIWSLTNEKAGMNIINQTTMELLFMNLSSMLPDIISTRSSRSDIIDVLEYIDANYEDGTLEEISGRLGYNTYYLSRLLKDSTGKNFKQLLQQRKLQQAIYYLENTTIPTDNIMEKIGYDNSSYFYRIFRERYGCTPRDYRLKIRSQNNR